MTALAKRRMHKPDSFLTESGGDKALDIVIWILVLFAVTVTAYPFLYVTSISFSDGAAVARGDVWLLPKGFTAETYGMVMGYNQLWTSYLNTAIYTVFGTLANVVFTCLAAYPLSRKRFFLYAAIYR